MTERGLIMISLTETTMMSGETDGPLVFGRIHSYSLQLRPSFPTAAFNKLLLKLPVRLVLYTTSLVIYEATFSLNELPFYFLSNLIVHICQ